MERTVTNAGGAKVLINSSYSILNHNEKTKETTWINVMITLDSISMDLRDAENCMLCIKSFVYLHMQCRSKHSEPMYILVK